MLTKSTLQKVTVSSVAILLAACAGTIPPPSVPPEYQENAPELKTSGHVVHTTSAEFNAPKAEIIAWISDGSKLVSAMEETDQIKKPIDITYLHGDWPDPGAVRRVEMSDGHYVLERVIENDLPHYFSYQIWNFTASAGRNLDYAFGEQKWMDSQEGGTELIWSYSVMPNARIKEPFVASFVRKNVGPFMDNALLKVKAQADEAFPAP